MPYRRGYNNRRKYYRKTYTKGPRVGRFGKMYLSKYAPQLEMKFFDVSWNAVPGDMSLASGAGGSYGVGNSLNLIPQGTGESQRIGRRAVIKSINARVQLFCDLQTGASTVMQGLTWRLILVLDRQANGSYPTWDTVLEPDTVNDQVNAFNNMSEKGRFQILSDKKISVTPPITTDNTLYHSAGSTVLVDIYKKLHVPIQFSGTGTPTISQVTGNNLFFLCGIAGTDVNPNGELFKVKCRVRFTD